MRVGVLTFHRALNYGAALQTVALQRCLEGVGVVSEVIDYECEALTRNYRVFHVRQMDIKGVLSAIAYIPSRLVKAARFRAFRSHHLRISDRRYARADISEASNQYDYVIVGSDQVWNLDITGGDETYFLDFIETPEKKLSYAASLGKARSLPTHSHVYLKHLTDFPAISVREQDSRDYLAKLLGRDIECVLDPVFFLSADEWSALSQAPSMPRPYILAFCLHEANLYRYVERLRSLSGWDVVYVPESMRTRIPGRQLSSPGIEELLGYIEHAEFVVTDSFHVLAMSIIFRRGFKVQLKHTLPELNTRITSLLRILGLEEQILVDGDYDAVELPWVDYAGTSAKLSEQVSLSLAFLRTSLGVQVEC